MLKGKAMSRLALPAAALLVFAAGSAQAHTGIGVAGGFGHGFAHPIGGLDHVLAMIAAGLLAVRLGGRALVLVPLSFIAMIMVGGAVGMAGSSLPLIEIGIGLSVAVLGLCAASGYRMPVSVAMALAGVFALFHGYAHGAEMPESLSGLEYAAGFVLATSVLLAMGIAIGLAPRRLGEAIGASVPRIIGSGIALAGVVILVGNL
jgi:urease accessory protein